MRFTIRDVGECPYIFPTKTTKAWQSNNDFQVLNPLHSFAFSNHAISRESFRCVDDKAFFQQMTITGHQHGFTLTLESARDFQNTAFAAKLDEMGIRAGSWNRDNNFYLRVESNDTPRFLLAMNFIEPMDHESLSAIAKKANCLKELYPEIAIERFMKEKMENEPETIASIIAEAKAMSSACPDLLLHIGDWLCEKGLIAEAYDAYTEVPSSNRNFVEANTRALNQAQHSLSMYHQGLNPLSSDEIQTAKRAIFSAALHSGDQHLASGVFKELIGLGISPQVQVNLDGDANSFLQMAELFNSTVSEKNAEITRLTQELAKLKATDEINATHSPKLFGKKHKGDASSDQSQFQPDI